MLRRQNQLPYRLSLITLALVLTSCSTRVTAPLDASQSQLRQGNEQIRAQAGVSGGITGPDLETEAIVSHDCVEAWRRALAGDVEGAIKQLKDLDKKYPKVSTIKLMLGQVLEHAGRKKEAIAYYRESVREFEFSSIHLFKLAEAMRTTGDAKGSIPYYRKLVVNAPDFSEGKLGLAKALLVVDPQSKEAKDEINQVLKTEPNNKEALAMLDAGTKKR